MNAYITKNEINVYDEFVRHDFEISSNNSITEKYTKSVSYKENYIVIEVTHQYPPGTLTYNTKGYVTIGSNAVSLGDNQVVSFGDYALSSEDLRKRLQDIFDQYIERGKKRIDNQLEVFDNNKFLREMGFTSTVIRKNE